MSYYYETAPLPAPLAWFAHNLPGWWHALESRATLVAELVVPVLLFCGRRGRLIALVVLTGFRCSTWRPRTTGSSCGWRWRCTCSCCATPIC
ncbi:lipase maturation factor family protein [Nannocystis pusilla]|uniref:Lipase maturation factor family protein n=1 Tax=Nannocystis pusilla TaxID=889268 RepID=A0A9X3J2I0_9BACT|nr:lipase maturation factor family protein [Nannocystis pusilla]MCY1011804.1 lipase maturation factor family protein [Nannocystis pusilla]